MMNLKKAIATLTAAVLLTMGTVSVASAGGFVDFFTNYGKAIVNSAKTIGNAVIGAGEYVFTDKDGEECFADMKKSAGDVFDNMVAVGQAEKKIGTDLYSVGKGVAKTVASSYELAGVAVYEGVSNLVTGNDDYSLTEAALNLAKEGYDDIDEGFDTVVEGVSLINPTVAMVASGVKLAKTAVEAAVDYKDRDWSDVGDAALSTVITVTSAGVGSAATEAINATAGAVTGAVTKTTMKTAVDLNNPDNNRSVVDTIVEDVTTGIITTGTVMGVKS